MSLIYLAIQAYHKELNINNWWGCFRQMCHNQILCICVFMLVSYIFISDTVFIRKKGEMKEKTFLR